VSQTATSAAKALESKNLSDLAALRRNPQPVLRAALELRP